MAKKQFQITKVKSSMSGSNRTYTSEGTIIELVKIHSYTLECGSSYAHEKGNKKINCNPKTIKSLITNLNNAVNNAAANGYAGINYSAEDVVKK